MSRQLRCGEKENLTPTRTVSRDTGSPSSLTILQSADDLPARELLVLGCRQSERRHLMVRLGIIISQAEFEVE